MTVKSRIQIIKKAVQPRVELLRCGSRVTKIEWVKGVKKPVVTYSSDYSYKEPNFEYLERTNRGLEE